MTNRDHSLRDHGETPGFWARASCYAAAAITGIAVVAIVLSAPNALTYDEPFYVETVPLLRKLGPSPDFLRAMAVPAGPLYALIHFAAEPLTQLRAPGVRLVNVVLICLASWVFVPALRTLGAKRPCLTALGMASIPMVITTSGMALTEVPAVFFTVASLALLLGVLDKPLSPATVTQLVAAGLAIGLAAIGRQPLVLVLACAPALAIGAGRRWRHLLVYIFSGAVLPGLVFWIWGGPTPPALAWTGGMSIVHGTLACAYALIAVVVVAPGLILWDWRLLLALATGGLVANLLFGIVEFLPMDTLFSNFLSVPQRDVGRRLAGGLVLALGGLFMLSMVRTAWEGRRIGTVLFLVACATGLVAANAMVGHQFSSRYIVPVVPFLVALDRGADGASWARVARLTVGSLFGLLSLSVYLLRTPQ